MTMEELEQALDKWGNAVKEVSSKSRSRDWSILPDDFETKAVKKLFEGMKWRFEKHNIASRIAASKAITFRELILAIDKAQVENRKKIKKWHIGLQ